MNRHLGRHRIRSGPQAQRGVAAVYAAGALIAMVTAVALAIDIGQLYYAQRDLEKAATVAALDAARIASGCGSTLAKPGTLSNITNEVNASIARNDALSNARNKLRLAPYPGAAMVEVGMLQPGTADKAGNSTGFRKFIPLADGDPKVNAVRVNLARPHPTLLLPFITGGGTTPGAGLLTASASAQQAALGSFYLGTTLASINASKSVLNPLLSGLLCAPGDTACQQKILQLDVASAATGLANVNVSLNTLATAAGVTVKDLSDAVENHTTLPVPTVGPLISGLATALGSGVSSNVAGLLQSLGAASTNPGSVPLGDLLNAVEGVASDVPFVDLLSLILGLAESANAGQNGSVQPIQLPVNIALPGASIGTFVKIGAPPKFSGLAPAGVARAETAEVTILVRIGLAKQLNDILAGVNSLINTLLVPLKLLGITPTLTLPPSLNLGIDVAVAPAFATMDRLQCPVSGVNGGMPVASLSAAPAVATIGVGTFAGDPLTAPILAPADSIPVLGLLINGGLLGNTNLTASLAFTTVGVSNPGPQPLKDINLFHRATQLDDGSAIPAGDPAIFLADGGTPSRPTAPGENPQTVGSPTGVQLNLGLNVSQTGSGVVGVVGTLVSGVTTLIKATLAGVLSVVNSVVGPVIDSLLSALGAQLGGATVTMDAVTVGQPQIITTCRPTDTVSPGCT